MELRIIRAFTGWTQRRLGMEAEISQTRVHEIEKGYYVPSDEEKIRIAAALNVSVEDIDWPKKTPAESNRNGATPTGVCNPRP